MGGVSKDLVKVEPMKKQIEFLDVSTKFRFMNADLATQFMKHTGVSNETSCPLCEAGIPTRVVKYVEKMEQVVPETEEDIISLVDMGYKICRIDGCNTYITPRIYKESGGCCLGCKLPL